MYKVIHVHCGQELFLSAVNVKPIQFLKTIDVCDQRQPLRLLGNAAQQCCVQTCGADMWGHGQLVGTPALTRRPALMSHFKLHLVHRCWSCVQACLWFDFWLLFLLILQRNHCFRPSLAESLAPGQANKQYTCNSDLPGRVIKGYLKRSNCFAFKENHRTVLASLLALKYNTHIQIESCNWLSGMPWS